VDASTPPSRTSTLRPTVTTLLGNASISMGRWKPPTRHMMLLLAVGPLQQGKTPGRLGMTVKSTPLHKKTEPRKLRSYGSSRQSSTRIASALFCLSRSSSRTCLTRLAEVSADGLERYTGRSSETESLSSPLAVSLERARTSWRRQCCCVICPHRQTPKRDAFETRCRLCSKWRQFSRPRARPLDVEERPQKSVMSRP
jgi:hypothetical protein